MSVGINIGVKTAEIKDARRQVDLLNEGLRQTEGFKDLELGKDGLKETSILVQQISDDIRRLKGLQSSGEKKGGLLSQAELKETVTVWKRAQEEARKYSQSVKDAKNELRDFIREKDDLKNRPMSAGEGPAEYEKRLKRVSDMEAEIEFEKKRIDGMEKTRRRIGTMLREGYYAASEVEKFGDYKEKDAGSEYIKKVLKTGFALMGGMTVLGFARTSMGKAAEFGGMESDLSMRNIKISPNARYGFNPMEELDIADRISKSTGYEGRTAKRLVDLTEKATRGMGLNDTGAVSGYIGNVYNSTGFNDRQFKELIGTMRDFATGTGQRGRFEDILRSNQQLIAMVSQKTGGKELSLKEIDTLTSVQLGLWLQPGMMGKGANGQNLMGRLNEAITSEGGTPGQQAFMFRALGGQRVSGIEGYTDYLRRKEAGLKESSNISGIFENLKKDFGTKENGQLSEIGKLTLARFPGMNMNTADFLAEAEAKGVFKETDSKKLKERLKEELKRQGKGGTSLETDVNTALGLEGNEHRKTMAGIDEFELKVGKELLPAVDDLKEGLTTLADSFLTAAGLFDPNKSIWEKGKDLMKKGLGIGGNEHRTSLKEEAKGKKKHLAPVPSHDKLDPKTLKPWLSTHKGYKGMGAGPEIKSVIPGKKSGEMIYQFEPEDSSSLYKIDPKTSASGDKKTSQYVDSTDSPQLATLIRTSERQLAALERIEQKPAVIHGKGTGYATSH